MAGLFAKYRVVLSGNILAEADRDEVLQGLAKLFNSKPSTMEALLQGQAVSLKKEYSKDEATLICQKIRKAGAQCKMEEIPEIELDILSESTLLPPDELAVERSHDQTYRSAVEDEPDPDLGRDSLFNLIMVYVNSNLDFYRKQFLKFGNPRRPSFKLTWNWPAFFFFFFWALYRKMWIYAAVYFVGGIALTVLAAPGFLSIVWLFFWPLVANFLYFKQATAAARASIAHPASEKKHMNSGGVSRMAVWLGLVIVLFASSFVGNFLTEKFMEQYGDQLQDVLPGSGSQTRGDGTFVEQDVDDESQLGKTSLTLSYLATSLKLLLVTDQSGENRDAIDSFVNKLSEDGVQDDWGQNIIIHQIAEGYELRSAGPDQTMNTDDDVLQIVRRD